MKRWLARLSTAALVVAVGTAPVVGADVLEKRAAAYKAYAIERIADALAAAKDIRAAIHASDVKAAQAAWIKSRTGWERVEPITGEFFPELDSAIDPWPDAKQGYHAIEARLFAGNLAEVAAPVDRLIADLAEFDRLQRAPKFQFKPQGLLNGTTKLAYEVGENKSKGGESPYAETSLIDMRNNVEGIDTVYTIVFRETLKGADAALARQIHEKIGEIKKILKAQDMKSLDQPTLHKSGEELAVLLQKSAPKLKLEKPTMSED
jgi:iron uptake system EfeUOB component EfeO/EfeM